MSLGLTMLPFEIVGTISKTGVRHVLNLQIENATAAASSAIYTHSGTGAVFTAIASLGEGEAAVTLSSKAQNVDYSAGVVTFVVSATKAVAGAKYAIRIGDFGKFKVAFDANGGTFSNNVTSVTNVYTPGEKYGKLPKATRKSYTFDGWHAATTNGVEISTNTVVCVGYTNLVAKWTYNPLDPSGGGDSSETNITPVVTNYCVRFNANGGYGNMATQTFTWGEAKALTTNAFARTNYTFRGWATSSAGAVVYSDLQVVSNLTTTVGGTVDLYAAWLISADQFRTTTVAGVTWSYTGTNGTATIQALASTGNGLGAAIDPSFRGTLQIPETLDGNRVTEIGERAFLNCRGITNVVIPLSVQTIGSCAFAGCTGLVTGVTIPESVTKMGSAVFTNCPALKIIRYYGDCPEADSALYAGAPASLISGVLRVRSDWGTESTVSSASEETDSDDDDDDDDDDDAASDAERTVWVLPDQWPSGSDGRRIYWLTDVKVACVSLNCAGGTLPEGESKLLYFILGRTLGELPEPTYTLIGDQGELVFRGWYTAKKGGSRVDETWIVSSNLKLYAQWSVSETEVSAWQEELVEDSDEFTAESACVYDGYLYEEAGSNDFVVVGTVTLKVAKGRKTVEDGETNVTATATATVKRRGAKQMTLKGTIDASGEGVLTSKRTEDELAVTVTADGLLGSFGDAEISGARNRTKSSAQLDKLVLNAALARWSGNWMVVLQADEATGEGAAFAQDCFAALSVNVGTKGKTKVTGTLPDGTKVSATGTMIVGDGCACVPVLVPLYTGKTGGLAFLLWFCTDEEAPLQVCGVSAWDAARAKRPFSATLLSVGAGRAAGVTDAGSFSLAGEFDFDALTVADDLLPSEIGFTVKGTRWSFPKADGVKFVRDEEEWSVTQDNGNPAALKLLFASKTGLFTGSFKVFGVTEAGKGKKVSAKVFGGCLEGVGYGSAFIKNVGSVPVTIE